MSIFRRRLMRAAADTDTQNLRYWWDAHDALVDGMWVDRVSGGKIRPKGGEQDTAAGTFHFPEETYASIISRVDLGRHFRIVFNARIVVPPDDGKTRRSFVLMEFGSVSSVNRGLYTALLRYAGGEGTPNMNYKMFGNNNQVLYKFPDNSFPFEFDSILDGVFEFGNEAFDDENDILWFRGNRQAKIYSINPHPIINHNGFSNQFLNRGAIGFTYSNERYNNDITYRSIKIYVYD